MMTVEEWEAKLNQLKKYGRIRTELWATADGIKRFEEQNSVRLPLLYREWLQLSDGCLLLPPAGIQLYGVSHKPLIQAGAIPELALDYCMVGAMPYGDPILFKSGGEAFMLYNQEAQRIEPNEVFSDFSAFLDRVPSLLGLEE